MSIHCRCALPPMDKLVKQRKLKGENEQVQLTKPSQANDVGYKNRAIFRHLKVLSVMHEQSIKKCQNDRTPPCWAILWASQFVVNILSLLFYPFVPPPWSIEHKQVLLALILSKQNSWEGNSDAQKK